MARANVSRFFRSISALVTWERLKRLGGNRLVRSSYGWLFIVPVVSKLLEPVAGQDVVIGSLPIRFGLPFSWKCFFFAAVFISIGNFLYDTMCPSVIRNFASPADFIGRGFTGLNLAQEFHRTKDALRRALHEEDFNALAALEPSHWHSSRKPSERLDRQHPLQDNAEITKNLFLIMWDRSNTIRPGWRVAAMANYGAGMLLVLLVAGMNVYTVLKLSV